MSLMLCIPPPAPEVGGITAAYTMITISNIVYKFAVCMVCRHFASTKWHAPLSQIKVHSTHGQPSYFGIWGRKSNMRLSHSLTSSYASNRELITPRELSKLWSACVKQNVRSSSQWWLCFLAFWTLSVAASSREGQDRERGASRDNGRPKLMLGRQVSNTVLPHQLLLNVWDYPQRMHTCFLNGSWCVLCKH